MNDIMYVRIDKNRKMPLTIFIRALGFETDEEIIELLGDDHCLRETLAKDEMQSEALKYNTSAVDESLKEIYKRLRPGDPPRVESAQVLINNLFFDPKRYDLAAVGRYKYDGKMDLESRLRGQLLARPAVNLITGELIGNEGDIIDDEMLAEFRAGAVNEAYIQIDGAELKLLSNGMVYPEAILGYSLEDIGLRHKVRYSVLSEIIAAVGTEEGDVKAEAKKRFSELAPKNITRDDILASVSYMIGLFHGVGEKDDIDHLGNRRLRCVGELLQNQLRIGFARMDKIVKERMTVHDSESITPEALINIRPVFTAIREFFGS